MAAQARRVMGAPRLGQTVAKPSACRRFQTSGWNEDAHAYTEKYLQADVLETLSWNRCTHGYTENTGRPTF